MKFKLVEDWDRLEEALDEAEANHIENVGREIIKRWKGFSIKVIKETNKLILISNQNKLSEFIPYCNKLMQEFKKLNIILTLENPQEYNGIFDIKINPQPIQQVINLSK